MAKKKVGKSSTILPLDTGPAYRMDSGISCPECRSLTARLGNTDAELREERAQGSILRKSHHELHQVTAMLDLAEIPKGPEGQPRIRYTTVRRLEIWRDR